MINLNDLAIKIEALIADQFEQQGHNMSGKFADSLRHEITESNGNRIIWIIDGTDQAYGKILNEGVEASRIPYLPQSERKARGYERSGGTSKYIQGLINFAKVRIGASDKDAISIAFAIANTQAKEGMPTKGSYQFSKTGQRKGFVEAIEQKIIELVEQEIVQQFEKQVEEIWQ